MLEQKQAVVDLLVDRLGRDDSDDAAHAKARLLEVVGRLFDNRMHDNGHVMRYRPRFAGVYTFWQFVYMPLRHKHLKIDQRKLDRAKRLLRLSTEQETVDRALDAVLAEDAIVSAHQKARRVGGVVDPFEKSR